MSRKSCQLSVISFQFSVKEGFGWKALGWKKGRMEGWVPPIFQSFLPLFTDD
jgi:hypothetical protein